MDLLGEMVTSLDLAKYELFGGAAAVEMMVDVEGFEEDAGIS